MGRQECAGASAQDLKEDTWRTSGCGFSSPYIIVVALVLGGIGNEAGLGLASADTVTFPVIRKYSQLEGSGMASQAGSSSPSGDFMTPEHAQMLRDHDYERSLHLKGRILSTTVVDFPLGGDNYKTGLYYAEIGLGTPSNSYYVQVDTGSDLLWVDCTPCGDCPTSSDLAGVKLRLYDPSSSSTHSNISCSSQTCANSQATISNSACLSDTCSYIIQYGDGSTAMGYLVQDEITYETGGNGTASAKVVFGCGFNQTGQSLTSSGNAVDGIMGFGQASLSVVSQLAGGGYTANEFAHCLQGDTGEGGLFVIGDVQEPNIVYTPLVTKQAHYNVNLQSISMNGANLNIPPSAFGTSNNNPNTGTIFDSGTTLAYIVDEAYDAFLSQLQNVAPVSVFYTQGVPCFQLSRSVSVSDFPNVTLTFEGTGSNTVNMNLGPTNYLLQQSNTQWCLAWGKASDSGLNGLSILGDIVLKNKLVVYDLANTRIGWVDYDCQSTLNVSNGTASHVVDPSKSGPSLTSLSTLNIISVVISSVVLVVATRYL